MVESILTCNALDGLETAMCTSRSADGPRAAGLSTDEFLVVTSESCMQAVPLTGTGQGSSHAR
jgi:hypothetical protein